LKQSSFIAFKPALALWRSSSHHARILRAMLSVSLFVGMAKFVGAAKEVLIAATYGTGPAVDAYVFLMSFMNWPAGVSSSVMMTVLVPYLVHSKTQSPKDTGDLKREFVGSLLLVAIGTGLVGGVAAHFALLGGHTGLTPEVAALASTIVLPMTLVMPFGIMAGYFAANVMADHRQANTLLEGVPALCIIILLLLIPSQSPELLAWSTLVGALVHQALLLRAQPEGERLPRPSFSWRSPAWRGIMQGFGFVVLGQILCSAAAVADQIMVAPLGSGANATLGYANRLISLFCSLGATAIGRAILPVLSEMVGSDRAQARRVAFRWMPALFLAGAALAAAAWIAAPWGVALLYQRGAFTAEDTANVTEAFRLGTLRFPLYFAAIVLVQLLAGVRDYRKFFYMGAIDLVTKVTANFFLIPIFGIGGVQLADCAMYAVSLVTLLLFSRR
jgi:peptidoglycan biosynthesis protein MviN/MurJ (putative lipid II flippase)